MTFAALLAISALLHGASPTPPVTPGEQGCELTVMLQCGVTREGATRDCKVVSEDPNGLSAGAVALSMASQFHLPAGEPREQSLIPIHIRTGVCKSAK